MKQNQNSQETRLPIGTVPDEEMKGDTVVAIDIGGGTTKLALVSRGGDVCDWQSFATAAESGDIFLRKVVEAARGLLPLSKAPVLGVSAAVAGFVGADGALEYNPNLSWLEGAPIASLLREDLGLDVHVDSDSNAACVAEYVYGNGAGSRRFLCLTGGTGMGVGMIAEGRLLRFAHGCMGDPGHIIISPEGPPCSCGGRGCAEALLSTAALAKRYAEASGREHASFRALVRAAKAGEAVAARLLDEAGYWLGITAASLTNIFFPDRIAIAGGLSQAGAVFMAAAQASFRSHGGSFPLANATMEVSDTGEHATLLGAAGSFFHPEFL